MEKRIDEHGVHLHGCECKECTKSNVTCPECGREYWTEWGDCDFECSRCGLHWDEDRPELFWGWIGNNPELVVLARERGKLREPV